MMLLWIIWPVMAVFFWSLVDVNRDEIDSEDAEFLDRMAKRKDAA